MIPFNPNSPVPAFGPGYRHVLEVVVLRSGDVARRIVLMYDAESKLEAIQTALRHPHLSCSAKRDVLERMGFSVPKIVGETWKESP